MVASFRTLPPGGWTLIVQHASGSLDTLVAQGRRRNVFLSFGILALLGVSVGLIAINAQRSQRPRAADGLRGYGVAMNWCTPFAVSNRPRRTSGRASPATRRRARHGELIDAKRLWLADMAEQDSPVRGTCQRRRRPDTCGCRDIVRQVAPSGAVRA
jgi:hypothetical protein